MNLDWLNEKRFSNSRAFFCPFHIFISFYLEVCKWSRFTLFILCIFFFFMKIRVCLNKCKHQFQQVSALFCCPSERYKTIIYHYCPFPSQTWYNTVFLPFYIWVIENHPGRFLSSVVVTEFVELLAQLIFVLMTWVLCWDASVCPPYSSLHRAPAPGSCFVWMHKWAFLPPGFWLGRMMGDIVSGSRKGRRERLGYFLLPCGISAA